MASENLNQSSVALTPVEATDYAESVAAYKAQKRPFLSFLSGISAGACIALAFVFYTTTQTASAGAPWGLTKLVGGLVFSLGVIMVVILGSELFTSSTLTLVARVGNSNDPKLDCGIFGQLCGRFIYCCSDLVWGTNHGSKWSMGFNHFGYRSA